MSPKVAAPPRSAANSSYCLALPSRLFVTALACLFGTGGAEEAGSPEAHLSAVIERFEAGDFRGAWRAYMAFFAHPRANELGIESFKRCFVLAGCVDVGRLGAFLGKSKSQAASIRSFCPEWKEVIAGIYETVEDPQRADKQARIVESSIATIKHNVFRPSCEAWAERQLRHLEEAPPLEARHGPIAVPLVHYWDARGQMRAAVKARIDGHEVTSVVDVGATGVTLSAAQARRVGLERYAVDLVLRSPGLDATIVREPVAKANVRLGRFPRRATVWWSEDPKRSSLLGMNILLGHGAVCFSWGDGKLHLGDLGPCAGGVVLDGTVTTMFHLRVNVVGADGTTYVASLDTGASHTLCTSRFVETAGVRFELGLGNGLYAECSKVYDIEHALRVANDPKDVDVGMDTLSQFSAFGWTLNPTKVLFVPRNNPSALAAPTTTDPAPSRRSSRLGEKPAFAVQ